MSINKKQYPRPPSELTGEALAEWHRCLRGFYRYDFIDELDRGVFSAYCTAYGRWAAAEAELKVTGLTVRGGLVANPLVAIAGAAMRDMVKFADQLGMTPASRARILAASAGAPLGKKEQQFRDAVKIASGRFAPAEAPRLVVVSDE